ncbi:hypothetical protein [Spiroplasma endosymbiont of Amphibalanus improvisus]|uniref:hypothetical protein n=1 Tax=Spiroplasma endosymbiont of Amphibalanus improvisus TaxID=3066327 RepID=UPI00313E3378
MNGSLISILVLFFASIIFYVVYLARYKRINEFKSNGNNVYKNKFLIWFIHLYLIIINFGLTITTIILFILIAEWKEGDGSELAYTYFGIWIAEFISYLGYFIVVFLCSESSIVIIDEHNYYFLDTTIPKNEVISITTKKIMYNDNDIVTKKRLIGPIYKHL